MKNAFNNNYILVLLNLKDKNISIEKISEEKIENVVTKVVYATLINRPELCPHCEKAEIIIQGYTETVVKLPPTVECPTRLKLRKQRYKCKCCGKTFVAKTDIVKKGCQISQSTKQAIALQATKKISEKDIAARAGVSHNTVNRIISSYYEGYSVNYHYLPQAMCFDEFKSTKDADGAMSFIYCDAKTHKILDIVDYLLDQDSTLKNTYYIYQELLIAIKTRDTQRLQQLSMTSAKDISGYMKTALQTLKDNLAYFSNSLLYNYSNGIIEGINNKIKVIKRISFGYRSFFNFRNRILIMCNLICIKKAA